MGSTFLRKMIVRIQWMNQLLEGKDSGEPRRESLPKEEELCSLGASWVVSTWDTIGND